MNPPVFWGVLSSPCSSTQLYVVYHLSPARTVFRHLSESDGHCITNTAALSLGGEDPSNLLPYKVTHWTRVKSSPPSLLWSKALTCAGDQGYNRNQAVTLADIGQLISTDCSKYPNVSKFIHLFFYAICPKKGQDSAPVLPPWQSRGVTFCGPWLQARRNQAEPLAIH